MLRNYIYLVSGLAKPPQLAAPHLQHEQRAQQQVAHVGEHMVEVRQRTGRVRAQEVVVAHVQRTRHVENLQQVPYLIN